MRVAIIIPYFGKWPQWFNFYLYSCSKNPMVDFLFYTDCDIPKKIYDNTIFTKISYGDYCEWVSQKMNINFHPNHAYKLCDLRPFFSIVHESDIKDYDFWGFADIDLFYGDLSMIVNEKSLTENNLITCHADRISGHFTIIRKSSELSRIGKKIKNWKFKLESQDHYGLDEVDLTQLVYPQLKNVLRFYRYVIEPMFGLGCHDFLNRVNYWYGKLTKKSFIEYYTTPIPSGNDQWLYDLEKSIIISPLKKRLPYLHFLFFKKTPYLKTDRYWTEGFWQIPMDMEYKGNIYITINGISNNK